MEQRELFIKGLPEYSDPIYRSILSNIAEKVPAMKEFMKGMMKLKDPSDSNRMEDDEVGIEESFNYFYTTDEAMIIQFFAVFKHLVSVTQINHIFLPINPKEFEQRFFDKINKLHNKSVYSPEKMALEYFFYFSKELNGSPSAFQSLPIQIQTLEKFNSRVIGFKLNEPYPDQLFHVSEGLFHRQFGSYFIRVIHQKHTKGLIEFQHPQLVKRLLSEGNTWFQSNTSQLLDKRYCIKWFKVNQFVISIRSSQKPLLLHQLMPHIKLFGHHVVRMTQCDMHRVLLEGRNQEFINFAYNHLMAAEPSWHLSPVYTN
mmetsp:Transcript_13668/g.20705  ORF Transcript_13668/g.20705 Transcript_13668/m.20705 type:complete len:314 (+) Transcript_13668:2748-3689(+)